MSKSIEFFNPFLVLGASLVLGKKKSISNMFYRYGLVHTLFSGARQKSAMATLLTRVRVIVQIDELD